jgi:hypothetical protein
MNLFQRHFGLVKELQCRSAGECTRVLSLSERIEATQVQLRAECCRYVARSSLLAMRPTLTAISPIVYFWSIAHIALQAQNPPSCC